MHTSTCAKTYTITEYESLVRGEPVAGYQALPERSFDALEDFLLTNRAGAATQPIDLLSLSARRDIGKMITARNYVGLIAMRDGTVIEILPKIANNGVSVSDTKKIFLEMLKTLKDFAFRDFDIANLKAERLNLFEIFIRMFLSEVAILVKQGLKSSYTPTESNERFYKGKLLVQQNLKFNLSNRGRFFVHYDTFDANRPENRLIKSALTLLQKQTREEHNQRNAIRLLALFDGIDCSANREADFSKCLSSRDMSHYNKALSWCSVFLRGHSFTAFAGNEIALALLFPMEKVFENYVTTKLRKHIPKGVTIRTQDNRYSLFDRPIRSFALRPDIVLESTDRTIVMDTKWKLLSDNARNNGISQPDMYQMYAYGKKYGADTVVLIYPWSDSLYRAAPKFTSNDGVLVDISFIDLTATDESIATILEQVYAPLCTDQL